VNPDDPKYAALKKESIRIDRINYKIAEFRSSQLLNEAEKLDVEWPEDPKCWQRYFGVEGRGLSPHGRFVLRKKIGAEKDRRFDVKMLWVTRFWLPLLTALVGIIGGLTGLVAVLHPK
jgi:hypothetical protein